MDIVLRISVFSGILIYFAIIFILLRKNKLNLKYSLLWIFSGGVMTILAIFPQILVFIADLFGIQTPVNALFAIIIFCILIILVSLTSIVSAQSSKITVLIQSSGMNDKAVRELEKKVYGNSTLDEKSPKQSQKGLDDGQREENEIVLKLKNIVSKNKVLAFISLFFIATITVFASFYFTLSNLEIPTYILVGITLSYLALWIPLYLKLVLNKVSLEFLGSSIVFIVGIAYLLTITPYSEPDSLHHYNSSYKLSNIMLMQTENATSINENHYLHVGLYSHNNSSEWYDIIANDGVATNDTDENTEMALIVDDLTYPILYLPQAIGITIARLLDLNYVGVMLLGRLFNLLFFSIAVYVSMRTIPRFKLSVFAVAMVPMTLHLASGFTYDTIVIALALLFVSIAVAVMSRAGEKITKSEIIRFILFGALLAPAKVIYSVLLLFVCFVPANRFSGKKQYFTFIGVFVLACGVLFSVTELIPTLMWASSDTNTLNWENKNNYTISFILANPIDTIIIFVNTTIRYIWFYFNSAFGKFLSGLTLVTDGIVPFLSFFALLLTGISNKKDSFSFSVKQKVLIFIMCFVIYGGVLLSMFLGWTSDDRVLIEGVQGRYFIPIMLPALLLISTSKLKTSINLSYTVILTTIITNVIVICNILEFTLLN